MTLRWRPTTPSWLAWPRPASNPPPGDRLGISGAVALRRLFAGLVSELFSIIGLTLAGGLLLLWVRWKMLRELCGPSAQHGLSASAPSAFWRAVAMVVADVSMFVAFDMIWRS